MKGPDNAVLTLTLSLGLAMAMGGCGHAARPSDRSPAEPGSMLGSDHRQVYERTQRVFAQGALVLPASEGTADVPQWMAPLLVNELSSEQAGAAALVRFGAVTVGATGRAEVDTNRTIIYFLVDSVPLGGRDFPELTFLWFYPPDPLRPTLRYRGFRMVLDERGFGILWEVLSSEDLRRIFYVGEPVEWAAVQAFGQPFRGRRFCVEPDLEEEPEVVVARLLTEGPQPMGPFVYLDQGSLSITTLLCRCMPSQVEKIERGGSYRLVRLAHLEDLWAGGIAPGNVPLPPARGTWEGVLRIPPVFRTGR